MKVLFVAGFGPVSSQPADSRRLYRDLLSLDLQAEGDYLHTEALGGSKHFAIWPLTDAAQSCFGKPSWPADIPIPQAWIEFEVEDLDHASTELRDAGYLPLVDAVTEPWGQRVTRFLSPEGLLAALVETPWLRQSAS
ncbi:MAG: glyoxalase [Actinomycetota bacterium]|nr:glyoxalase [Actinomycetota bacterium]MDA8209997.1 glyoxalase [Actinomycetota bacterium]